MTRNWLSRERGAVLVHVAVAMLGFLGFSALVIDFGIMWSSRRQAQNSADAAALAAAISMAFDGPGDYDRARATAKRVGESHKIFNLSPTITQGSGSNADITQDISFPPCPPGIPGPTDTCVRVNVYRDVIKDALPTFFAGVFGVFSQGVKATATSQILNGNQIQCLLPFAVIDRWADNFDDKINPLFPPDAEKGKEGWTQGDDFQRDPPTGCSTTPCDEYIGPYQGNTNHTGFTVDGDYGRQLVIKAGKVGEYSTGWAQLVYLPGSIGGNDVVQDILQCNKQPVGIADSDMACGKNDPRDEPAGCVEVKPGMQQSVAHAIDDYVATVDSPAHWDPLAPGPDGKVGAVVGGLGMGSPRIRGIVIFDINTYIDSGCDGGTCRGKVANIIGFFVEGVCNPSKITMDPGITCDTGTDIVGRIVKLTSTVFGGAGEVEETAAFLQVVRLVR
jgi:hypothetical protein